MFPYTRVGVKQGKCQSNVHTILLRPSLLPSLSFCVPLASIRLASANLLLFTFVFLMVLYCSIRGGLGVVVVWVECFELEVDTVLTLYQNDASAQQSNKLAKNLLLRV